MYRNCTKEGQRSGMCALHLGGRVKSRKSTRTSSVTSNTSDQPQDNRRKYDSKDAELDETAGDTEEIRAANILIEMGKMRSHTSHSSHSSIISPQAHVPSSSSAVRSMLDLQHPDCESAASSLQGQGKSTFSSEHTICAETHFLPHKHDLLLPKCISGEQEKDSLQLQKVVPCHNSPIWPFPRPSST